MSIQPYILHGFGPSPYSVKMRAILRYRRLPFIWKAVGWPRDVAVAAGLPPVIPALTFPDGTVMNDSTPLAHALERAHPGRRSIVPDDPAHGYLSDLLEDFGDEWVTKIMFHYRWFYAPDREFAQVWVISSRDPQMPEAERREAMQAFNDRQVGRMAMVGCTDANRPVIEDSYRFILDTLDPHVRKMEYLFGSRPSLADFGLFGQLQILSVDPTPMMEMRERAPDVYCWLLRLDDASGVEGEWLAADAPPSGRRDRAAEALRRDLSAVPCRQSRGARKWRGVGRSRHSRPVVEPGAVPLSGQMLRRAAQEARRAAGRRAPAARSRA